MRERLLSFCAASWGLAIAAALLPHWTGPIAPGQLPGFATSSGFDARAPFYFIAGVILLPVIAAFRVFIKNGQWVKPLPELWEKYGPKTVAALWDAYRESGKTSAAVFGRTRSSWAAACDLTKSAAIQLGVITVA